MCRFDKTPVINKDGKYECQSKYYISRSFKIFQNDLYRLFVKFYKISDNEKGLSNIKISFPDLLKIAWEKFKIYKLDFKKVRKINMITFIFLFWQTFFTVFIVRSR